ncbi:hypothetical protein CR513_45898, partial [Mucuna pruriens]
MTKLAKKGNFSCRNWRSYAWKHMKTPGSTKEGWDRPFVITNVFPYGVVELRDEANNRNFKVNGHRIKPFHEGSTPLVGEVESILIEPSSHQPRESSQLRPTPSRPGQALQPNSSRISRDVLRSIIRRLNRDEVVSAKTDSISAKPDQARLHDPSAQ